MSARYIYVWWYNRERHWKLTSLIEEKHYIIFYVINSHGLQKDGCNISTQLMWIIPVVIPSHREPRVPLHWRHNARDGVSNHQPHDCLLNRLFRRRSKKTSKLRVTGLCVGISPVPAQMASNAENVSIWWRHRALSDITSPALFFAPCWLLWTSIKNKYNNWCKASKLIAPALTTIWSQIFKMGSWKNNNPAMPNCLLLVISVLLLS